ncbi:lipid-A-disaccharide synthase [Thiobacter aerophilum]|uniref:Lipid-A-disaccharide synthase n=1 Tax=Thiobacter aerophilum TaxID=3121275 RepID=A0ABV0EEB9_9BURK
MEQVRIGIVAGEASGDLLGSHLVTALKSRLPGAHFEGIGGPKMIAAGVRSLFSLETLAVRGYVEALRNLPAILRIRRRLRRHFLANRPHLFIGVDAPDFNLGLARVLKAAGIPTFQYVGPSVWAWRAGRLRKIRRAVSHMLLLFPFEPPIYEAAGIPATYVGHPLADLLPLVPDRAAAREALRLPPEGEIVALLPGSRQSELALMADLFVKTAQAILRLRPGVSFLVPLVTRETRDRFEAALYAQQAQDLPLRMLFGHAHAAMTAANAVLVASGTATLEAALVKRPMVITYRVPTLTYRLMWPRRYLPYVGLPNVLAGRFVVPELLQNDATPENLAQAVCNLLAHSRFSAGLEAEFLRMHELMRRSNAEQVAATIATFLEGQRG